MKPFFLFFLSAFLMHFTGTAQNNRIKFDYDPAGNQIRRYLCFDCLAKTTDSIPKAKDLIEFKEEDFLKFSPSDEFSYYPNPVKEELYLKWESINENKVSSIEVYSITGQILKHYHGLESQNTKNISFQEYVKGTYLVVLNYLNGEKKSITILKQ